MPTPLKAVPAESAVERLDRLNRDNELLREEIAGLRSQVSWTCAMNAGVLSIISDLCTTIDQPYASVRADMVMRIRQDLQDLLDLPAPLRVDV